MDLAYVHEKLSAAILGMMQSTQPLQKRLEDACIFDLNPAFMGNDTLPEGIREQLKTIQHAVTKISAQHGEGDYNASTRAMPNEEVQSIMEKIFILYDDVQEALLEKEL